MVLVGDGLLAGVDVGGGGALPEGVEADACVAFGVDVVERRPVLPAVAVGERVLVDHPGTDFALAPGHQADRLHQFGEQEAAFLRHRIALRRGE